MISFYKRLFLRKRQKRFDAFNVLLKMLLKQGKFSMAYFLMDKLFSILKVYIYTFWQKRKLERIVKFNTNYLTILNSFETQYVMLRFWFDYIKVMFLEQKKQKRAFIFCLYFFVKRLKFFLPKFSFFCNFFSQITLPKTDMLKNSYMRLETYSSKLFFYKPIISRLDESLKNSFSLYCTCFLSVYMNFINNNFIGKILFLTKNVTFIFQNEPLLLVFFSLYQKYVYFLIKLVKFRTIKEKVTSLKNFGVLFKSIGFFSFTVFENRVLNLQSKKTLFLCIFLSWLKVRWNFSVKVKFPNNNLFLFLKFFCFKIGLKTCVPTVGTQKRFYLIIKNKFLFDRYFYFSAINLFTLFKKHVFFFEVGFGLLFLYFFVFSFFKKQIMLFDYSLIFIFKLFSKFCFFLIFKRLKVYVTKIFYKKTWFFLNKYFCIYFRKKFARSQFCQNFKKFVKIWKFKRKFHLYFYNKKALFCVLRDRLYFVYEKLYACFKILRSVLNSYFVKQKILFCYNTRSICLNSCKKLNFSKWIFVLFKTLSKDMLSYNNFFFIVSKKLLYILDRLDFGLCKVKYVFNFKKNFSFELILNNFWRVLFSLILNFSVFKKKKYFLTYFKMHTLVLKRTYMNAYYKLLVSFFKKRRLSFLKKWKSSFFKNKNFLLRKCYYYKFLL